MAEVPTHDPQHWGDDPVPLEIDPFDAGDGVGLRVTGELDLAGCDRLVERVAAAVRPGAPVHIDLRAVTFLDSTGVRALLAADRRAREGGASEVRFLAHEDGYLARVFAMFGAGELLEIRAEP